MIYYVLIQTVSLVVAAFILGLILGFSGRPASSTENIETTEEVVTTEDVISKSVVEEMIKNIERSSESRLNFELGKVKEEARAWMKKEEKKIRGDAIKRHKDVTKGKTTEHLIPYADDFDYNPSDCRFMGSPIDIVVFDGLSDGNVRGVVFIEVKTGKSASLSTRERKVRDAIRDGKVSWRLVRQIK